MAEESKLSPVVGQGGGKPFVLILAIAIIIVVVGLGLLFTVQRAALNAEQTQLNNDIATLQGEIALLEEAKVEAAQQAQEWLAAIEEEEIRWSKVITQLEDLIPTNPSTGEDKVSFFSYNGSDNGRINLNGQTTPQRAEPFEGVAELISTFNANPFFRNAYVPSLTRAETDQGDKFASFVMSVEYHEEEFTGLDDTTN